MIFGTPLQSGVVGGLPSDPMAQLLIGLVALLVVMLVVRFVMNVAWKLLLVAAIVVGAIYGLGVLGLSL